MPTNIRIIDSSAFVKATAEETMDLEESREGLRAIAVAATPLNDYGNFLHMRKAVSQFSAIDLWYRVHH